MSARARWRLPVRSGKDWHPARSGARGRGGCLRVGCWVGVAGGQWERLASGAIWSEGPVWMFEDQRVLWSDIPNKRMLRWHPTEGQSVWRDHVEYANGHYREVDGALLHCSHDGKRA